MNPNLAKVIVDIECIAIPDAKTYLEPVTPDGRLKDAEKIAANIREKEAAQLDSAALDCDLGCIVALGWMVEGRDVEPIVHLCKGETEERASLSQFWCDVLLNNGSQRRIVSFNGLKFDLPYLMRRSLYLDLDYPRLNLDKYRTPHQDIANILSYNGTIKLHSLMFYAKRFGLPIPEGAAEIDGSMIAGLVAEGQWEAVRAHCAADVQITYALATRLGLIDQPVDAEMEPVF